MSDTKLPDWLSSTYVRYKQDTTLFTSWIANTAFELGHASSEPKASAVSVSFLLQQAEVLAKASKSTEIPEDVHDAGRAAVRERKECSKWYQSAGKAFEGHKHFVQTLERILDLLQPLRRRKAKASDSPEAISHTPNNRYELLERFESPSSNEDQTDRRTPKENTTTKIPEAEDRKDTFDKNVDQEWQFRAYCTLKDFHRIHTYIVDIWKAYQKREAGYELMTVAAITEASFNVMEQMEKDTLHPTISNEPLTPVGLIHLLFWEHCRSHGMQGFPRCGNEEEWRKVRPFYNYLFLNINFVVQVWGKGSWLPKVQLRKVYGTIDDYRTEEEVPESMKGKEDELRLAYILSGSIAASILTHGNPLLPMARDRVTKELCALAMKDEKRITSVWLLCALKIVLDINKAIRLDPERPLKEMLVSARLSATMLRDHKEFLQAKSINELGLERWDKKESELLNQIEFVEKYVGQDTLMAAKRASLEKDKKCPDDYHLLPQAPHSQNPVLCGLVVFAVNICRSSIAGRSVNTWWAAPSLAHLYNALQKSQSTESKWPAMESFIKIHKPEHLFFGGAPSTLESSFSKLLLAEGVPVHLMSRDARCRRSTRLNERRQIIMGRASDVFKEYFFGTTESQSSGSRVLAAPLAEVVRTRWSEERVSRRGIDQVRFLQEVRECLVEEIPLFKYNHFAFNQQCIRMVRCLWREFVDDFNDRGLGGLEQENSSLCVTVEVVLKLILHESQGMWPAPGERPRGGYPSFIAKAASVLESQYVKKKSS